MLIVTTVIALGIGLMIACAMLGIARMLIWLEHRRGSATVELSEQGRADSDVR